MSLDTSLPSLHLRITHTDNPQLEQIKKFVTNYAVPTITVLEEADEEVNRTHTHTFIQTNITINTFRKQLKKEFPLLNGNKDFQLCQVKDTDAMLRYVSKGKISEAPQVIYSSIASHIIAQYHIDYWKINSELQAQGQKSQKPKKTQATWTTETYAYIAKKVVYYVNGIPCWTLSEENVKIVSALTLKHLGKTAKKLSFTIVNDIVLGFVNALLFEYGQPPELKKWTDSVGSRIWNDNRLLANMANDY